ncbi:DUF6456 domain-containing protein [Brevundimonas sp. VNH65]|uniref:DUF6456 domain-containing protein n=1 Tax=Brevundimonas sp. VNH65 TaxID=3400917 RepID=UPI003C080306
MTAAAIEPDIRLRRARSLLSKGDAWIDEADDGAYPLRLAPDRRRRAAMRLTEAELAALIEAPGLRARPAGGWISRRAPTDGPDQAGRPGVLPGERTVTLPDGRTMTAPANLGQCPLDRLFHRRDADGRPLLSPARYAAGQRLRSEAEQAMRGPSLTMRWDALPRASAGSAARVEPGPSAHAAARRVVVALAAVSPRARPLVERVCLAWTGLQTAEAELGLRRRQGRGLLEQGLDDLARHYGLV